MYKVLVVDDEDIVRKGLKKIISNMNLKISKIDEARDGKEALDIFHSNRPNIIITDIKMPNIDGLELVEIIRKFDKNIKFIILSGYGEFSYAQKAIQYGVTDYLLKPFKNEKLNDILSGIISHLDEERQQTVNKNIYIKTLSLLQEKIIKEVLNNEYKKVDISKVFSSSKIAFLKKGFLVFTFHISNGVADSDTSKNTIMQKLHFYLEDMDLSIYSFSSKYGHIMCLLNLEKATAGELMGKIRNNPGRINSDGFDKKIFIGSSQWMEDVEALPVLAAQSLKALDYRLFMWDSPLLCHSDSFQTAAQLRVPAVYYDKISTNLADNDLTDLNKSVDEMFSFILKNQNLTPDFIINTLKNLVLYVSKFFGDSFNNFHMCKDSIDDIDYLYQTSDSIMELRNKMKEMLCRIIKTDRKLYKETGDNSTIGYAIRYMEKNFNKDISLDMVANQVSMNSNYFSSLFRKKTGYSFVKYLQKLRIEKAKKLLSNPMKRNYEIAAETGFENDKYFCKVFKELTGLTPLEYREQLPRRTDMQ